MKPAMTSADVTVLPPQRSQYPSVWSGSVSAVNSQPSVMQIAGHTLPPATNEPMMNDDRIWTVKELLFDYVKSPSLKHIRDPHSVSKLAQEIVRRLDRGNSIWQKWNGERELLLKPAVGCWIPIHALRAFLNRMPGSQLTETDVTQRLKAFEDEYYYD
jgi:hypothetical protein